MRRRGLLVSCMIVPLLNDHEIRCIPASIQAFARLRNSLAGDLKVISRFSREKKDPTRD
jgi:hypothetical protein